MLVTYITDQLHSANLASYPGSFS